MAANAAAGGGALLACAGEIAGACFGIFGGLYSAERVPLLKARTQ